MCKHFHKKIKLSFFLLFLFAILAFFLFQTTTAIVSGITIHGQLDEIKGNPQVGNIVSFIGWAADETGPVKDLKLILNGQEVGISFTRMQRQDVADTTGNPKWLDSGWKFDLPITTNMVGEQSIVVKGLTSDGQFTDLPIPQKFRKINITSPKSPSPSNSIFKDKKGLVALLYGAFLAISLGGLFIYSQKQRPDFKKQLIYIFGILITTVLTANELYSLINKNSVNILFSDQWEFLSPLFKHGSYWDMFEYLHGPPREGLGLVITSIEYEVTKWNVQTEAFLYFLITLSSLTIALIVTYLLRRKFLLSDFILPIIFLTTKQYETYIGTPNLSYSILPIFMIALYCGVLLIKKPFHKIFLLLVLNFFLVFTGFGFFIGLITPLIFIYHAISDTENKNKFLIGVLVSFVTLFLFFYNYRLNPAVSCFRFPYEQPLDYINYSAATWGGFLGYKFDASQINFSVLNIISLGFALLVLSLFAIGFYLKQWATLKVKIESSGLIVITLILFSIFFTMFNSVGRVCMGIQQAESSRYSMLIVPGIWGLYIFLSRSPKVGQLLNIRIIFAILIVVSFLQSNAQNFAEAKNFYNQKNNWMMCYLQTNNIKECETLQTGTIYHSINLITDKIDFLKKSGLNFFAGK